MLDFATITYIINSRRKDAAALYTLSRYSAAVYLMGYAVEVTLKKKICTNFRFAGGFPETAVELSRYGHFPFQIRDIKTHDLSRLLFFSGRETLVKTNHFEAWKNVSAWNAELRYRKKLVRKGGAELLLKNAVTLIKVLS